MTERPEEHTELFKRMIFAESHAKEAKRDGRDAKNRSTLAIVLGLIAIAIGLLALWRG